MNQDHELRNYLFDLPDDLIAQRPASERSGSKLLVYDLKNDRVIHSQFSEIKSFLPKESTLVFNQSKVFPCRLLGEKPSGGKAEIFVLSTIPNEGSYRALIKSSGKKGLGNIFLLESDYRAIIEKINGDGTFQLSFNFPLPSILESVGLVPIPPYIRSGFSDQRDKEDYQTVYAKNVGSVAAPTAGLHFTPAILDQIENKAFVDLHVGLGTFAPVKAEKITDHQMHREEFFIDEENYLVLGKAKKTIAVGTTSLRVLESLARNKITGFQPNKYFQTDIFIYPGQEVLSIDGLITNFHLPGSSLLMLVSALIGREKLLDIYREAIEKRYRFFSYGDAMLILKDGVLQ